MYRLQSIMEVLAERFTAPSSPSKVEELDKRSPLWLLIMIRKWDDKSIASDAAPEEELPESIAVAVDDPEVLALSAM
jgi:hypothetical protein